LEDDLKEFVAIFNGEWWMRGRLIHYCKGPTSCKHLAVTRARMRYGLRRVILRRKPTPAESNKWTKHRKSSVFYGLGDTCHGVVSELFDRGLARLEFKPPANNSKESAADCNTEQGISWPEVQGRGKGRAQHTLHSVKTPPLPSK
jgi:hypothetical protein